MKKREAGKSVVIIGGGTIGCETALWLARQDKAVMIVEALDDVMTDAFQINRDFMLRMLSQAGVTIVTGVQLCKIIKGGHCLTERRRKTGC